MSERFPLPHTHAVSQPHANRNPPHPCCFQNTARRPLDPCRQRKQVRQVTHAVAVPRGARVDDSEAYCMLAIRGKTALLDYQHQDVRARNLRNEMVAPRPFGRLNKINSPTLCSSYMTLQHEGMV